MEAAQPKLRYDGLITISTGTKRNIKRWRNQELLWSELLLRLAQPILTKETVAEYQAMTKAQKDTIKDVGGFVGGPLAGGQRKLTAVKWRQLITLDMDHATPDLWDRLEILFDFACAVYSTHSHTPLQPRLRLVIPLQRPVTVDEYQAVSRRIAGDIGIEMFDPTTFQVHRLMYWPSCPCDAEPVFHYRDAPWLDPDTVLARYTDWRDPTSWPEPEAGSAVRLAEKQEDPTTKRGIVGAFCRTYSIEEAIEKYLSDVYAPAGENRYTYIPGTTTGGLVIYDDGLFAYSHHGTDPVSGRLVNAFDLVRLHKFGKLDDDAEPDTPTVRLPSYLAMCEWASKDEAVVLTLGKESQEQSEKDFGANKEVEVKVDWTTKLERTSKGVLRQTRHNALLILENDPKLVGKVKLNELTGRPAVCGELPWRRQDGDWTDRDAEALRHYMERCYGLDNVGKIADALGVLLTRQKFHPVREYLNGLTWDGVERLDQLFINCLDAEDTPYVRAVTRKALVAAVARVETPGCKWDHIPVLMGAQGIGKSLLLKKLGRDWFSDSLTIMSGKEAYEQLQGVWILELGELAAMRRSEVEAVKHFVSKQEDIYRVAYARHTTAHPRQVVFFGSTNAREFLQDATGNRRFWPIPCLREGGVKRELLELDVDQIWAEAVAYYRLGEELYLSGDTAAAALEQQERYREESEKAGAVREFLERPIPKDWAEWDLVRRREFWSEFGEAPRDLVPRERVCVMEIWVELFNGDPKQLTRLVANELHDILKTTKGWKRYTTGTGKLYFGTLYGHQRAYVKV